ncbi:uncharacterized protein LAESUDRAFT_700335 [Laetiporus sulphureus 93-53]|uniref:XRRM domain-containing protein n=1 Tax=Laetiporus sulphureus 93-53 TaxID=1314785 RepID=A0A165E913_9APHY|nr:uncharacterized protein LAESUDRAFT_700335 [Laetiporus sulphureus 93-53]KZT06499.1 hypothetical protein LAESUDRAFT_700335 [Laetiporus sulphureus 93-53]
MIASGRDGYVPLRYVLRHSDYVRAVNPLPLETALVKILRNKASDIFDVRMTMTMASQSTWYRSYQAVDQDQSGGFEIRRRDWETLPRRLREYTKQDWDLRSVYIENLPPQYSSMPGIARFVASLLADQTGHLRASSFVQSVWLPRHHQDRPGSLPKCKGFAVVTMAESRHAESLLCDWPWNTRGPNQQNAVLAIEAQEATKYSFRSLSKARWDRLGEEYLGHRQKLLAEIATSESKAERSAEVIRLSISEIPQQSSPAVAPSGPLPTPSSDIRASYPRECLVFVRNIHPETNKTTLRTLFSRAFPNTAGDTKVDAIDYVDFNKGMDTCYLRLTAPQHARTLVASLNENLVMQAQGLDSTGTQVPYTNKIKPITAKIVEGTREELYWNKVPEKVRLQAMKKATTSSASAHDQTGTNDTNEVIGQGESKRKRRRKK